MPVVFMMMPYDLQKFANYLELYSPPPYDLRVFTYFPLYLSASTLNSLNFAKFSDLSLRK
jgi:hypothetical protein